SFASTVFTLVPDQAESPLLPYTTLFRSDRTRDEASQSHRPHRDQRRRLYRAFRRRSRMADVPPGTKRFLWHERLHEVGRHEGAWPEDLRGEPANGGEVRLIESDHRFLPSSAAS